MKLPFVAGRLVKCGLIFGAVLFIAGCPLEPPGIATDIEFPSNDAELICTVAVRNPDAAGGTPQASITSVPTSAPSIPPSLVRSYYLANDCISGVDSDRQWGFNNNAEAVSDWQRFYPRQMQQLATDPVETSIFAMFPTGWCEVAGSAVCTPTGGQIGVCRSSPVLTAANVALPTCLEGPTVPVDPPPTDGACLNISCGSGDANCSLNANGNDPELYANIAFGAVSVGATPVRRHTMTLTHCGGDGDADTTVTVDGMVTAISALGNEQFLVPIPADTTNPQPDENGCYPPDIGNSTERILTPGQSCTFPVFFEPQVDGIHSAYMNISSNARPQVQVNLSGEGGQASLVVTLEPGTLETRLPTASGSICMAESVTQNCTAPRNIELSNRGASTVTVQSVRFAPVDANNPGDVRFEVASSFPAPNPAIPATITLNPGDAQSFQIRWCGGNNQDGFASLLFDSDAPDITLQAFSQPVRRDSQGCMLPDDL